MENNKKYSITNYASFEKLYEAIVTDLNTKISGKSAYHRIYGPGIIKAVLGQGKISTNTYDFYIEIAFDSGFTRVFAPSMAIKNLNFDEYSTYAEYFAILIQAYSEQRAYEAKKEEELKLFKKELEEKHKYENKINAVLNQLKNLQLDELSEATDEFYVALGWLAKHATTASASIPDYTESWFKDTFGQAAPYNIVDSRRRTSGGYLMRWAPSFTLYIKNAKQVPSILAPYVSRNCLHNTKLIYQLVENYGFNFGSSQNFENIKTRIPTQFMSSFNLGLTLI